MIHFGAPGQRSDFRMPTDAPAQIARSAPRPPACEGTSVKSGVYPPAMRTKIAA